MNCPNAAEHRPDPDYLRGLIAKAGLSQAEAARRIGISQRTLRHYLAAREARTASQAPYPVQYALESLARAVAAKTTPLEIEKSFLNSLTFARGDAWPWTNS